MCDKTDDPNTRPFEGFDQAVRLGETPGGNANGASSQAAQACISEMIKQRGGNRVSSSMEFDRVNIARDYTNIKERLDKLGELIKILEASVASTENTIRATILLRQLGYHV